MSLGKLLENARHTEILYAIYSLWKITIKFGYLLRVHQSSMYNVHTLAFYSEKNSLKEIGQDQFSEGDYHFNTTYDLWNVAVTVRGLR